MITRLFRYFSHPHRLALLNGILIAVLVTANLVFQAFCIPTDWAILLLALCFGNTICYPLITAHKRLQAFCSFINGISSCLFIYCICFLGHINLFAFFMIPAIIGLVLFIPHFFVAQLFWKNLARPYSLDSRRFFLLAIVLCVVTAFFIGREYKKGLASIIRWKENHYQQLDKTFMTEKILGMHLIYHTRICEYDGWRPPKHEPVLVMGLWLNNFRDPLNIDLKTRLELYKKNFPGYRYKFDCSCGWQYRQTYHEDDLWK